MASNYWLIFFNVSSFFFSQGLKAGKSLSSSFFQALSFVHNRVEEEIKVMKAYLLQITLGDLSLKKFEVKRDEWKRLQAFQVQCCFLTSKDSWKDFCDEFLSCKPVDAYPKISFTLSALPPLPSSQVDEGKKGWWVSFKEGTPHSIIDNFIRAKRELRKLKNSDTTTDEVCLMLF